MSHVHPCGRSRMVGQQPGAHTFAHTFSFKARDQSKVTHVQGVPDQAKCQPDRPRRGGHRPAAGKQVVRGLVLAAVCCELEPLDPGGTVSPDNGYFHRAVPPDRYSATRRDITCLASADHGISWPPARHPTAAGQRPRSAPTWPALTSQAGPSCRDRSQMRAGMAVTIIDESPRARRRIATVNALSTGTTRGDRK
jgi:hypothetical protein